MAEVNKKVLVAEDEVAIAKAMELKFKGSGYDVVVAANGQEAIDALKKDKYDVLLLDLVMPVVDGFGVLEAIKKEGIRLPVVVLSNLSQAEDTEKVKELGAIDYFVKSDTPIADIVNYVNKLLKNGNRPQNAG